jgi:hypothetical protein
MKSVRYSNVGRTVMPENAENSVYQREKLDHTLEEAFSPLWELGVLGVKLTLSQKIVKIKVYLLGEFDDSILTPALDKVEANFDETYKVEHQIVHGIVPAAKVTTLILS